MSQAWTYLATNSGMISAVLGFVSAITLGLPAYREIRDRRHWDALSKTVEEQAALARAAAATAQAQTLPGNATGAAPTGATATGSTTTNAAATVLSQLDEVQWDFVKQRMGSYLSHRRTIVAGLLLLALSFAFDIWDNVMEDAAARSAVHIE